MTVTVRVSSDLGRGRRVSAMARGWARVSVRARGWARVGHCACRVRVI